ncbi:MAG: choline dehydrogenase, partial [Mesorhizobium sp.]
PFLWLTSKAFLRAVLRRSNLRVVTGAEAETLDFDGASVTGVAFRMGGQLCRARAGETILAAGAINSPKLLELSGVGRPEVLGAAGIP